MRRAEGRDFFEVVGIRRLQHAKNQRGGLIARRDFHLRNLLANGERLGQRRELRG